MVLRETRPIPTRKGTGPRLAMVAVDGTGSGSDQAATASVSLFDGPVSSTPEQIRSGIYLANIEDTRSWGVNGVPKGAIALSGTADTAQATNVSHTTFSATLGTHPVIFDYWAFASSGHRYMLSYARTPKATTPDAATFFGTATSCPKSTP